MGCRWNFYVILTGMYGYNPEKLPESFTAKASTLATNHSC
jgi:hypothetical protein